MRIEPLYSTGYYESVLHFLTLFDLIACGVYWAWKEARSLDICKSVFHSFIQSFQHRSSLTDTAIRYFFILPHPCSRVSIVGMVSTNEEMSTHLRRASHMSKSSLEDMSTLVNNAQLEIHAAVLSSYDLVFANIDDHLERKLFGCPHCPLS